MLHGSDHLYKKFFKNPYLRVFVGGCIVVVLTLLVGDQTYNGTGINIIARCMDGTVRPEAFFLKMLFTAATLGAGYKAARSFRLSLPERHSAVCSEMFSDFRRPYARRSACPQSSAA